MILGWIITIILAVFSLLSFTGVGYMISPWYNTLSEEEKESYSKAKVSVYTGINLAIFAASLAVFMWFLSGNFADIIKITVSLIFFLFIVIYIVVLNRKGLKNCKK